MRTDLTKQAILLLLLLMIVPLTGYAEGFTPQTYVAIDLEVRKITLNGMAESVALLRGGSSTPEQEIALALANQQQVDRTYRSRGTSAAAHAAYGSRYAKEIEEWLAENPDWQQQYDSLIQEFNFLSNQLNGLRGETHS